LLSVFSKILPSNVVSIKKIGRGGNSRVYIIDCDNFDRYIGKLYFTSVLDKRDRIGVEYSSLKYLWKIGIRCIPKAIAIDREHHCAIYEHIQGEKISSDAISVSDIDYAVEFLIKLNQLKTAANNDNIPEASEACFSLKEIIDNIYLRLKRLQALQSKQDQYRAMHVFLKDKFIHAFNIIQDWSLSCYKEIGIAIDNKLPFQERTLSPSDFGFHNALRRPGGNLVFLDFEYFGWDDPAKMISDFLLHPAMDLNFNLKKRFVDQILLKLDYPYLFRTRLKAAYPLFGLKWCMILLNEFLSDDMSRRTFSSTENEDASLVRSRQLSKASNLLTQISLEYNRNKYFA